MFLERRVRVASTGVVKQPLLTGCDASMVDLHADPKGSNPRSRDKACWHLGSGKQVEKRDREGGSVINVWGLLGSGLRGIKRNRRASNHRSPLARIPLETLFNGKGDLLVHRGHAATSSPQDDSFTSALDDPRLLSLSGHAQALPDPRWKIPPSEWGAVLRRVEQGEPLRHIGRDYGVSYEAVRRVLRTARRYYIGRGSMDHPRG
jgi:hypothetical protein